MSIDLNHEEVLTLAEVAKTLPPLRGGRQIHISTLYRWISHGVRGVRLEALLLGRTRVTSREALQRFADRLSQPESALRPVSVSSERRAERIERELARHGF